MDLLQMKYVYYLTFTYFFAESSNELFDDFELSPEKSILGFIDFVVVHAQNFKIDSRNGFNQALVRGGHLEFSEKAGTYASSGGAGQTNLKYNNKT